MKSIKYYVYNTYITKSGQLFLSLKCLKTFQKRSLKLRRKDGNTREYLQTCVEKTLEASAGTIAWLKEGTPERRDLRIERKR